MAVSPAYAEGLAQPIAAIYQQAELIMLEILARHLSQGTTLPDWAERKLLEVQLINARIAGQLTTLSGTSAQEIAAAITKAYNRGQAGAVADLNKLVSDSLRTAEAHYAGLPDVMALVQETTDSVTAAHSRILRAVDDIYRQTVQEASAQVLVGTQTRLQATQRVFDRLTQNGITGFVDKAGRAWDLSSYVEMAVRTASGRAAVQGHTDRLQANGYRLVIVSDAPQDCPLCRPWDGKILSLGGLVPGADDTLDAAEAAGLFHPSCRHSLSAYQEGVTKPAHAYPDAEGYRAQQQQRYLERGVRRWKRQSATALTPEAKRAASAKVRVWQQRSREHAAQTGVARKYAREQVGQAH